MRQVKKILVPVDFSPVSRSVLEAALYLAGALEAEIHLVTVVQSFADYDGFFVPREPLAEVERQLAEAATTRLRDFAAAGQGKVTGTSVLQGDAAAEIVRFAGDGNFDLIVMGTHGYRGLDRVLFGSVAARVVTQAACPVLTTNPYRQEKKGAEDK